VIATSDFKILFYSLYMAELKQLAIVDIGAKILSISVGDAGGDDRREVLVGVSEGPLKVIEGLYQIIPSFQVAQDSKDSSRLRGKVTVANITNESVNGITGKIYHFPKDNMEVNPQQLRFDLGPGETKAMDVELIPKAEGTIIVRPIVLMWTDNAGQVRQVTTPETAILVEKDQVAAAPAEVAPVSIPATTMEAPTIYEEPSPFTPPSGTGFGEVTASEVAPIEAVTESEMTAGDQAQLKAAEDLLDQLFGEDSGLSELDDVSKLMEEAERAATEPTVPVTTFAVESALVTEIRARTPKPPRPGAASDSYSYLFKVMVTGEGAVGKTALVTRYTTGQFQKDYKTTIGSQFAVKLAHISPPEPEFAVGIKIQAWDVAGQARFKAVRKMYYSGAAGLVLVFDVTRRRSFVELQKWVEEADESVGQRIPIICIGNKIDLPDRAIPSDEAKKWAEDQGFVYMESSAKTGMGVSDMFLVIAELMWRETRAQSDNNQAQF
jgi:small GTP-binding protein